MTPPSVLRTLLDRLLPRRSDYDGLRSSWRGDLLAGVTVGVVALPLALAFGVTSGVGAAAGLITAIVAGLVAGVLGGSSLQVSGPTGAMTVVLLPIVALHGTGAVFAVAIMGGVLVVVLGLVGLGRAIQYIPWPVVEGDDAAIADGHAMGVVGQISQDRFGAAEGAFGAQLGQATGRGEKDAGHLAHV